MPDTININRKVPGTQAGQRKRRLKNIYLSYAKHSRKGLKQKPCLFEITIGKGSPAGKKSSGKI